MFSFSLNFYLYTVVVFVDPKFTWAEVGLNKHVVLVTLLPICTLYNIIPGSLYNTPSGFLAFWPMFLLRIAQSMLSLILKSLFSFLTK